MLRLALDLAHPLSDVAVGPRPGGRLYLCREATCMTLGGNGIQPVQFVLLPYPTPACYLFDEATQIRSLEERHRKLQQALIARLDRIKRDRLDPRLPSVLSAHVHIRGSRVPNLYDISEAEDVVFEPWAIPTSWAYVALGHIHNAQALSGAPHVRYAGSIERLDFAERNDAKSVVLVEVGPAGLVGEPVILPLEASPIYEVVIADPEVELPGLADRVPDRERALVRYSLTWKPGAHNRDDLCRQVETIFPRWYQRDVRVSGQGLAPAVATSGGVLTDVPGTTRAYLAERLQGHPDREVVLALAERYLAEQEGVA
jgi:exonuclease SbcD